MANQSATVQSGTGRQSSGSFPLDNLTYNQTKVSASHEYFQKTVLFSIQSGFGDWICGKVYPAGKRVAFAAGLRFAERLDSAADERRAIQSKQ